MDEKKLWILIDVRCEDCGFVRNVLVLGHEPTDEDYVSLIGNTYGSRCGLVQVVGPVEVGQVGVVE